MNKDLIDIIEQVKRAEESAAREGRGAPTGGECPGGDPSADAAMTAFREELLGRIVRLEDKASRAFLCIEEQREQLQMLEDFLNGQEKEREQRRAEVQTRRKERRFFTRVLGGSLLLMLTIVWAQEIADVGWALFRMAADVLNVQTVNAIGFLTSAALAALAFFAGRGMIRVIGDDLLDGEV